MTAAVARQTADPANGPYAGQYALAGPARIADPRVTPIRGDLADIALAGKLFAPHYVVPLERAVVVPSVALRKAASDASEQTSELLAGESFMVLDIAGRDDAAWAWGYGKHDDYLGYLPMSALGERDTVPPAATPDGADPVASAEAMVGMPYLWGGRGGGGIDCSGLVQVVFARAGIDLPRDSDQQADAPVGRLLDDGEASQRGDLLFFPDHVMIQRDAETVIHASQDNGKVSIEALADVLARKATALTGRRRVL
ncbi:C40 family peptidase [Novosphingobium tardum]|uniref:C40 family peptidase n=1 Tax=Novosphingobium tardum TaxID=1538021 RepID=A0ABV8RMM8_9SPHN